MSGILIPTAVKCLVLPNPKGYVLLGILALSYWGFLAALIGKITREIGERKKADVALEESEAGLQEALTAGQVVAFTWEPGTGLSRRSENAPQVLGIRPNGAAHGRGGDFLARVHPEDRPGFAARIRGPCVENPSYSTFFRFIRPDGREVWLEETGKAEFDATGRYWRLKGLTRDITERKRAEERQRMLICELDHRVKNVLASVATVARRTREDSRSTDEFLLLAIIPFGPDLFRSWSGPLFKSGRECRTAPRGRCSYSRSRSTIALANKSAHLLNLWPAARH
jgi:hypothetical protein